MMAVDTAVPVVSVSSLLVGSLDVTSIMQEIADGGKPCKLRLGGYYLLNRGTGEKRAMNCHSWDCGECRGKQVVKYGYKAVSGEPDYWFTITNVPDSKSECAVKWQQFIAALRKGFGKYGLHWWRLRVIMGAVADRMGLSVSESQWGYLRAQVVAGFSIEYFRVLERGGKTGMRHFHVLVE